MATIEPSSPISPSLSDTGLEGDCEEESSTTSYLEQVLSERNTLRAQNSQLWKIIQKQRVIIQQLQRSISKREPDINPATYSSQKFSDAEIEAKISQLQSRVTVKTKGSDNNPEDHKFEKVTRFPGLTKNEDSSAVPTPPRKASTPGDIYIPTSRSRRPSVFDDLSRDSRSKNGSSKERSSTNQTEGTDVKTKKRRSKTLPSGYRQNRSLEISNEKDQESSGSSKVSSIREGKKNSKTTFAALQAENLIIEASAVPIQTIDSRVIEYNVKKSDPIVIDDDSRKGSKKVSKRSESLEKEGISKPKSASGTPNLPINLGLLNSDRDQMELSSSSERKSKSTTMLTTKTNDPLPSTKNGLSEDVEREEICHTEDSLDDIFHTIKDTKDATSANASSTYTRKPSAKIKSASHKKKSSVASQPSQHGVPNLKSLENIVVTVAGCTVKINSKGKEVLIFKILVNRAQAILQPNGGGLEGHISSALSDLPLVPLWTIEKLFSDLLELDNKLRSSGQFSKNSVAKLPEKKAWNTSSPSKIDQRKLLLQNYLQLAVNNSIGIPSVISEFITSDIIQENDFDRPAGQMEGYLIKRGKNFGKWKRRYFSLNSDILEYFESKNGAKLGEIHLAHAQVAVQHTSSTEYEPGSNSADTFRHAFMILEPKKSSPAMVRHVLCADSDMERDEWVKAVGFHFISEAPNQPTAIATPASNSTAIVTPLPITTTATAIITDSENILASDSTLSPTHLHDLTSAPNPEKETIGGALDGVPISNMSTTSLGSCSSASSDPTRSTNSPSSKFRNRTIDSGGTGLVVWPKGMVMDNNANSSHKDREISKPSSRKTFFWNKKIFSGDSNKGKSSQAPVFGVPLKQSVSASKILEGYALSSVVYRCIQYLDMKQAHLEEGLYRLSGSSATIRTLRNKFDTEGDFNILDSGVYYDVHAVAGLLKLYLRELPSTVLTADLHRDFLQITELSKRRERVHELGRLVCSLPIENYTLLRALIGHLIVIVQESETNKMTLKNVGIVFAPTLGIPAGVFSLLMMEFKYIFFVDADGTAAPQDISEGEESIQNNTIKEQPLPPSSSSVSTSGIEIEANRARRRPNHRRTASADTAIELGRALRTMGIGGDADKNYGDRGFASSSSKLPMMLEDEPRSISSHGSRDPVVASSSSASQNNDITIDQEAGTTANHAKKKRSNRNSVIYRTRAPPELVRQEETAGEFSIELADEIVDDDPIGGSHSLTYQEEGDPHQPSLPT